MGRLAYFWLALLGRVRTRFKHSKADGNKLKRGRVSKLEQKLQVEFLWNEPFVAPIEIERVETKVFGGDLEP